MFWPFSHLQVCTLRAGCTAHTLSSLLTEINTTANTALTDDGQKNETCNKLINIQCIYLYTQVVLMEINTTGNKT
jgi:hypothetical protein